MPPDTYIALLVTGLLGSVGLLLLADEFRLRRIRGVAQVDTLFRCTRCTFVYTDDPGVERSRCPQCGQTNQVVRF
jgi:uncharacterized paraquat-inducible protein A